MDSPTKVQQYYENAILQKGWAIEARPGHISVRHYHANPSGRDDNGDTVEIDIWSSGGRTYAAVNQFHGIVYFNTGLP
jgi:hypothetical protein